MSRVQEAQQPAGGGMSALRLLSEHTEMSGMP